MTLMENVFRRTLPIILMLFTMLFGISLNSAPLLAQQPGVAAPALQAAAPQHAGGEANLVIPDLSSVTFMGNIKGTTLLEIGLFVCLLGLGFGLVIYTRLKKSEDAIQHAMRVCELEPNDPFSFTALSVTFQRAGRIPEAEEAMARARMMQGM